MFPQTPLGSIAALAGRARAELAAFQRDERGAVAVLVAAAIIPLIGALGLATDTARGYMVKARLSQALDAAALAGGKVLLSPATERDADVNMFFAANFPPGYMGAVVSGPFITVNAQNTQIDVNATATIETTFMRVLGYDTLTVAAETAVTREVDQLDLVLSIDTSGSMNQPSSKIEAAREAATDLVTILFGSNTVSPTVTVDGKIYDLLNIGVVNWNAKVNATLAGTTFNGTVTSETVPSFTNPVTGLPQNVIYYAHNSPVPLLSPPDSNWSGCVYARYTGDSVSNSTVGNTNDADLSLGPVTVGGAEWLGWEPIPSDEGEPRGGKWDWDDGEPSSSPWYNTQRSCHGAYWNDNYADPSHPVNVPNAPGSWRPAVPTINNAPSNDCTACPDVGILPLQTTKSTITDLIATLQPGGNTNIPQGLAWAWEVLMPGDPFDEAEETVPFPRQRAIVLLTDGQTMGGNGDAYKGRFSSGSVAGTSWYSSHGYLPPPDDANTRNNLNNRLKRLAANIKAQGITLYVIQFDETSETLTNLLKSVATSPEAPYYFNAPTTAELKSAFRQIANNLSSLRLSK